MAVCKNCGCAIPLGSKKCDMCATTASIAPAQPMPTWSAAPPVSGMPVPPVQAGAPQGGAAILPGLPPAADSPQILKAKKSIRSAWQFIAFIGALGVVLGAVAEVGQIDFLLTYFDWGTSVEGLIFLALAYFIRGGSLVALGIAIGLYALDTVALFLTGHFAVVRILILLFLVRALGSANVLRQYKKMLAQQGQDQSRAA